MATMQRRATGRSRLTLALLLVTSAVVLTLDFRDVGVLDAARDGLGTVVRPLRDTADTVAAPFQNAWHGVTDYGDVRAENEALRARIEALEGAAVRNADVAERFDELSALVDVPWVGDVPVVTARLVARPASSFSHVVEIDKGSAEGLAPGMPVATGAGLVGRVVEVTSGRASVQLLTDPELRVGVRMVQSQELGTARGQGHGQPLAVDTGIAPGEGAVPDGAALTTSGIDRRSAFPGSVPVGRVSDHREAEGGLSLELLVEPAADLSDLSYVNVLLWEPAG